MLRVSPVLDLVIKEEKEGEESYKDQREMDKEMRRRKIRGWRPDQDSGNMEVVSSLHNRAGQAREKRGKGILAESEPALAPALAVPSSFREDIDKLTHPSRGF